MLSERYSNKAIMELIEKIENDFPVATWSMDGINIWPIIRNGIPYEVLRHPRYNQAKITHDEKTSKNSKVLSCLNIFKAIILLFKLIGSIILKKKEDYFCLLVSDGASKICIKNIWWDKFCDPMKEEMLKKERKSFLLEQKTFLAKPTASPYYSIEPLSIISYYAARVLRYFVDPEICLERYSEFLSEMQKLGLNGSYAISELKMQLIQIKLHAYFYRFLINKFSFKKASIVGYYSLPGYGLSLACRRSNIECIEIEHGSVFNCPAYVGWKQIPTRGYELLPNAFSLWNMLAYDEIKKENNAEFFKHHKLSIEGIPFLKYWKSDQNKFIEIDNEVLAKLEDTQKLILVTLQPQFYGYNDWEKVAKIIEKSSDDWFWWIRMHPCNRNTSGMEKILSLKKKHLYYDNASIPLYSILNVAACHVTTASASALEAIEYKVPTIFVSKVGLEDFYPLISSQHAYYRNSEDEIYLKIKDILELSKEQETT